MKVTSVLGAALALALAAPSTAGADDGQAFLAIFAETTQMRMVGMPEIPEMPELPADLKLPAGVKLPGGLGGALQGFGRPARKLSVRLWSPGIAPEHATAALAIPEGLKLGAKLDLQLYRPKPGQVEEGGDGPNGAASGEFSIKRYWGSSPTVKDGQPEIVDLKGLTPEQQKAVRAQARQGRAAASYFYKPDWTTGYWPTDEQPGRVARDAELAGHYALTTSYTGQIAIDVPDSVGFLDPIALNSPDLKEAVALDKPIVLRWKAIPGALGLHARIMGMVGRSTLIIWDSSEVRGDPGLRDDFMQMAEVRDLVAKTIFMPGSAVDVTVPIGIFKDCDMVFMQMVGYGPGTALASGQPLPRVQTRTSLQVMLGGKHMADLSGAGDEGGE